jgi:NAD+ kinase
MKRVGVVLHAGKNEAADMGRHLVDTLASRGIEVVALPGDAARVDGVAIAGDGTLLRAAELVGGSGVPLLGVNLGRLGFLSELERTELDGALARIADDGFHIDERMLLEAVIEQEGSTQRVLALNDVIVEKTSPGRSIRLDLAIGGEPLAMWAADGIIVATPTGSTAYSFSAGGPIVSPRAECVIVTPVAPHGIFNRAVIAPPDEEVLITVLPDADASSLSADGGPALPLAFGARVRVRAAPERLRLAKLEPTPFWRLLREKFGLRSGS